MCRKFRSEAQAAAGLLHPNIVNVYDVGEDRGLYYMVMELVDGITLKEYIEKKGRLTHKEVISIAIQMCAGIGAAHAAGIIHRDIKPQNIIILQRRKGEGDGLWDRKGRYFEYYQHQCHGVCPLYVPGAGKGRDTATERVIFIRSESRSMRW